MTRPCTCALGSDPNCPVDHAIEAEREQAAIDEAKAVLFSLRTFREEAEIDADNNERQVAMHAALDADDVLEAHRIRLAMWDAFADSKFGAAQQGGIFNAVFAAHRVKRDYQRDETEQFPERVQRSTVHPNRTGASNASLSSAADLTANDRRFAA